MCAAEPDVGTSQSARSADRAAPSSVPGTPHCSRRSSLRAITEKFPTRSHQRSPRPAYYEHASGFEQGEKQGTDIANYVLYYEIAIYFLACILWCDVLLVRCDNALYLLCELPPSMSSWMPFCSTIRYSIHHATIYPIPPPFCSNPLLT